MQVEEGRAGGFTHLNPLRTSLQQHTIQTPPASLLHSSLRTPVEEGKESDPTYVSLNSTSAVHAVALLPSALSAPMRAARFMTATPVVAYDEEEEEQEPI
jgi:hypothetical protein